jgi:hypothetical protein
MVAFLRVTLNFFIRTDIGIGDPQKPQPKFRDTKLHSTFAGALDAAGAKTIRRARIAALIFTALSRRRESKELQSHAA